MPAATPALLAAGLGLAGSLPLLPRALDAADGAGAYLLVWPLVAVLAVLASQRWRLPSVPGPVPGLAWLLAGTAGAAVLGRRAVDCLLLAAAELPISSGVLPGIDLGDTLLAAAALLMVAPFALRGVLRRPRPGLALVAVAALVVLCTPLVAGAGRARLPGADPAGALALLPVACTLAWCGALLGPCALALRPERRWLHRVAPPLVLGVTAACLPALLWTVGGGRGLLATDGVAVARAGARAFGHYGARVGAGLEASALLLALLIVLVLATRVAARSLPRLGGWVLPLAALAAAVLQARMSFDQLVLLAALAGWGAVLLGGPNEDPT